MPSSSSSCIIDRPILPPTDPPECDDHGGNGGQSSSCGIGCSQSEGPVRYADGHVLMSFSDLSSGGFGKSWGHRRHYSNQLDNGGVTSHDFDAGFNWLAQEWMYIADVNGDQSELRVILNPQNVIQFNESGSSYVAQHGRRETLTHDATNDAYELLTVDGTKYIFHDFDQTSEPQGGLKKVVLPGGQTITVGYSIACQCEYMERSNADDEFERFEYDYITTSGDDNEGRLQYVTMKRKTGTGSWSSSHNKRRIEYVYYKSSYPTGEEARADHGSIGDVELAIQQEWDGADWVERRRDYYRYYKDSLGSGFQHGMKYYIGPEAYARIEAYSDGTDPLTASDTIVDTYADNYFEYDSDQRVTLEAVNGGQQEYTFAYSDSTNADGYNSWARKTTETRQADSSKSIVYTNYVGQTMLVEFQNSDASEVWLEYFKYDSDGRMLEYALPSAVSSYDDAYADLNVTISSTGLVQVAEYGSSTTASSTSKGDVEGYLATEKIRKGDTATEVTMRTWK